MNFIHSIQQNLTTAVLFWSIFGFSIAVSKLYQNKRIYCDLDGKVKIKNISYIKRCLWTILIIVFPSLLIGFRNYEVGVDTIDYVAGYLRLAFEHTPFDRWDRILYSFFRYGIFILSNGNPTFFLFSIAFVTLFILVRALDKWADKISIPMALFVYYALFGMQLLNQSRQLIALSILFYAIPYLLERKYTKYLLCILIASLFHFTASIGIIFALLYFKKDYYTPVKKALFYTAWLLSPVLMYPLLTIANRLVPGSYRGYLKIATYGGTGFGFILTIIPIIIPIFFYRRYIVDNASKYLARIALLTYPLRFAGYYSYYLMRLNYYSSVYIVLVIPLIIVNIKSKSKKSFTTLVIIITLVAYYIVHYMYLDAGSMFPYEIR